MQDDFSATNLLSLVMDLFGQVQRTRGNDRVKALRVKLGNRVVKEVSVGPLTTAATLALILLAVVISTLSIEVQHESAH